MLCMSALPRSKVPQRSCRRAAGQPVVLRRPSINLSSLSARSFAMGGVELSKRARFCVEGRWPCRGPVPVSRAGRRVEGRSPCRGYGATTIFKKNWLRNSYIGPIKMSVAKKKRGMVQLGLSLPPPAMKHGGAREGAGRKGARVSSRIENGRSLRSAAPCQ